MLRQFFGAVRPLTPAPAIGSPSLNRDLARIECTAHHDNSANNASNPNPNASVRWGDQTWEEMMIGFVDYSFVGAPETDAQR